MTLLLIWSAVTLGIWAIFLRTQEGSHLFVALFDLLTLILISRSTFKGNRPTKHQIP